MTCDGGKLAAALANLEVIPTRSEQATSNNYSLTATKDHLSLRLTSGLYGETLVPWDRPAKPWAWCVDRKSFSSFVGIGSGAVSFEVEQDRLVVKREKFTARFEALQVDGFASHPPEHFLPVPIGPEAYEVLRFAGGYTLEDAEAPEFGQICLVEGRAYATNRLSYFCSGIAYAEAARIPAVFAPLLIDSSRIWVSDVQTMLELPDGGWICQPACSENFPLAQLQEAFTRAVKWPKLITFPSAPLTDALVPLKRLDAVGGVMRIVCAAGQKQAKVTISGLGAEFSADVPAQAFVDADEEWLVPSFLPYLREAARLGQPVMVSTDQGSPYLFRIKGTPSLLLSPRRSS